MSSLKRKKDLVFSGVQPSAAQVHAGNYLGAMRRFVELSEQHETMVCIVDLHALTTIDDAEALRENTRSLAAAYLAIGLNPEQTIIFCQSDVPEVCELTWYLACRFPLGLLERAHAVKDAREKSMNINAGVMYYPILMAADILLYKGTMVPVGADQKQHLEMTREIVAKFNATYGDIFPMPEPLISEQTGVIPGIDGRKMSKSYDNYIGLFEKPKALRKKIMRIVTDSKALEDVKDPDDCTVFTLYKFFASEQEQQDLRARYLAGGMGYGHAKEALFEAMERAFSPIRDRYEALLAEPQRLEEVLQQGAERARKIAQSTIAEVRSAVGVRSS